MSMLAVQRGSGTTGLPQQPPIQNLTLVDQAGAEPPSNPFSLRSSTTMSTITSGRRASAPPATAPREVATTRPTEVPVRSRCSRARDYLFGVGSDRVEITTVQREALRQPYLR